jgi:hypothetical protein
MADAGLHVVALEIGAQLAAQIVRGDAASVFGRPNCAIFSA